MRKDTMDIAIVGAGAAAVGLLDALAATGAPTGRIAVLDPSPHPWRGRPYGPDLDSVLVNAPPAIMSIRHGDAGHYAAWLGTRGAAFHDELLGHPIVPRALYGEYLAHTAEAALDVLRDGGWDTRVIAARVTAVSRSNGRLTLSTADGRTFDADRIALCVGGGTPEDHYGLTGAAGFVADPYPLAGSLDGIPPGASVAIIGSGLTAVDVAVSLAARAHAGPIALVSRSGVLPHVWQRPADHEPRHLTTGQVEALQREHGTVSLDALTGLLKKELADAGEDFAEFADEVLATLTEDPAERLRRQLDAVHDPRIGRRVLQSAAHMTGPYAWRLLPEPDRARLRRHFRVATSLASPMVPGNAATLLRLFDSGQLTTVRGVRAITASDEAFRIDTDTGDHYADTVINAVNPPPRAVPRSAEPLATALEDHGLAARHPSGGLVPSDPRLHIVGDLSGGGPFITSGIPGVAAQAARTAAALTGPQSPSDLQGRVRSSLT